VVVTSRVLDDYNGAKAHDRHLHRHPKGPQWFVVEPFVRRRVPRFRAALLSPASTVGQPYSDVNIATDRDSVLDYTSTRISGSQVRITSVPASEPNHMTSTFIVTPGPRFTSAIFCAGLSARSRSW